MAINNLCTKNNLARWSSPISSSPSLSLSQRRISAAKFLVSTPQLPAVSIAIGTKVYRTSKFRYYNALVSYLPQCWLYSDGFRWKLLQVRVWILNTIAFFFINFIVYVEKKSKGVRAGLRGGHLIGLLNCKGIFWSICLWVSISNVWK